MGRLEAGVAEEVAQLEAGRDALATERAQLTTAWRSFESCLVAVRATNEDEQCAMEEARAEGAREWKFLEDAARLTEASRQQVEELQNTEGDLRRWEEDVAIREVDTEVTAADLGTREELLTHLESEAAEAAAATAARDEQIAKSEADLVACERALSELAGHKIALDLGSAILYLHAECEQCIVHGDIKPSNVGHGAEPQTTQIVAGQRPTASPRALLRRVRDKHDRNTIHDVADRRLNGEFDERQMESVLVTGLWCAHRDRSQRPSIALRCEGGSLPVLLELHSTGQIRALEEQVYGDLSDEGSG
ncbi:uncharacterized protein LOC133896914 [Phragmites australis]|uniref:uncharacterized protein LOC133896914 n=1 Tax=Phragmites australis TaxID=29695 RepID=UPI002D7706E9|nr:uncharacterized protein LOC133896914 [Phragmites australis]